MYRQIFITLLAGIFLAGCAGPNFLVGGTRGESAGFVRAAIDDALDPNTAPSFCQETNLRYNRTVSGVEQNRRDGDVTVRHSGGMRCESRTMRRTSGGGALGEWQ